MKQCKLVLWLMMTLLSSSASAAWFEASGQAVIQNGNKQLARQQATQEAIRQALLFAGASVRSVQKMADGLLQDERFEIRAAGEVNSVELIDEMYQDNIVTIRVRADIFPNENMCNSSDYKKSVVSTWFHMENSHQATVGGIFDLGKPLAEKIKQEFSVFSRYAYISRIEPYSFAPAPGDLKLQATSLAQKTGAQFVLMGSIVELSVQQPETSYLDYVTFWESRSLIRNFGIKAILIDGSTGELLFEKIYRSQGTWDFDLHQMVDTQSNKLWQSSFGASIKQLIQKLTTDIDETIRCLPSYGRIVQVANSQVSASIGSKQGVKKGDELAVFQIREFFSPNGSPLFQYQVHPSTFIVEQVFHNSAILVSQNAMPLGNIQPNDFVVRR
ncbi:MAG: flagellar assembly protein T N-terminal domain-containing protein [Aestuariibacter sp.]